MNKEQIEQLQGILDDFAAQVAARLDATDKALRGYVEKRIGELPAPVDGRDGADGRDALALEILPTIDLTRSYARGTFATFNGGLWRAFEKTHELRGWECIVDGIAGIELKAEGREVKCIASMASGAEVVHATRFDMVIDKGVYKHGSDYEVGDGVTWAGSYWIAQRMAPERKPGEGDDWRLAVKRGRDASRGVKV